MSKNHFRVVNDIEIARVLGVFNARLWPIPFTEVDSLFGDLQWTKTRRKGGRTNFDISKPFVSCGELGGELSRVEFRISDTFPDDTAAARRAVAEAYPSVRDAVTRELGIQPRASSAKPGGDQWDLADGRRIKLYRGERMIELQHYSKRYADIERSEEEYEAQGA